MFDVRCSPHPWRLGGELFLQRHMALEAIDFAKAGAVPRDLIFTEEHASACDEDRLMAVCVFDGAVDMVDPVAAQRPVWERNELRLVIASGVNRP